MGRPAKRRGSPANQRRSWFWPAAWTVVALVGVSWFGMGASSTLGLPGTSFAAGPIPTSWGTLGTGPTVQLAAASGPLLTLVPIPEFGNAPLLANVSVTVTGGVAPFDLSLCFGTADHSSPPPNCGGGRAGWVPSGPLVFSHVYTAPGSYSVVGVVTDAHGAGSGSTALIVVTAGSALAATAHEVGAAGTAPLTVEFNGTVSGGTPPISLQWFFGDGSSGSELPQVPVRHVYTSAGEYQPSLRATDGAGHTTVQNLPVVTVSAPPAGFLGLGLSGPTGPLVAAVVVFLVAVGVMAAVVRALRHRRWRQEGDDLVRRVREGEGADGSSPASP